MILVFGTLCLDRLHRIAHLPPLGGYVEIEETSTQLGGEAANTAYALSRWGAEFELIGNSIGQGPTADLIREKLESAGLSSARIGDHDNVPPVCEIMVTPDGQRTMFGVGFACLDRAIDIGLVSDAPSARWFTADPNLGGASLEAARTARDQGAQIYWMDFPLPNQPGAPDYQPGDWWQSSTDRYGVPGDDAANSQIVALLADHGLHAVLSDGQRGFIAAAPDGVPQHFPAMNIETFCDSTGAGDCFRAGMLYGLDRNWPIYQIYAFAAAAGALACRGFGAMASTPTLVEIEDLIASNSATTEIYRMTCSDGSISATP